MTIETQSIIAVNRFGLGARPGELASVASDSRGWLKAQLSPGHPIPELIRQLPSSREIGKAYSEAQGARAEVQRGSAIRASRSTDADAQMDAMQENDSVVPSVQ